MLKLMEAYFSVSIILFRRNNENEKIAFARLGSIPGGIAPAKKRVI